MFLGWVLAGEVVTLKTLVAASIIVASVALIIRHDTRRAPSARKENVSPLRAAAGTRRQ